MDLVDFAEEVFTEVRRECADVATRLGASIACVPVSATHAHNVDRSTVLIPWSGGVTLLQCLQLDEGDSEPARIELPRAGRADLFEATIVWTADRPMLQSRSYLMSAGTATISATVAPLKYRVDARTFQPFPAKTLDCGDVGVCNLQLDQPIAFDPPAARFRLLDAHKEETVGVVRLYFALRRSPNVRWQARDIDKPARATLMGQKPCVIWFTGLSGAGKSTIANLVEKRLHALGRHT